MRISIVLYDTSVLDRIKVNTYKYFSECSDIKLDKNKMWLNNMYIEFHERIIILNSVQKKGEIGEKIENYMYAVLKDEEVTIFTGENGEYCQHFGKSPSLTVKFGEEEDG